MGLITQSEVIEIAINQGNIDTALIKNNLILLSELSDIKPIIGKDLYNKIVIENEAGLFTGGISKDPEGETRQANRVLYEDFIRPALAYFIKGRFVVENGVRLTAGGSMVNETETSRSATRGERADQQEQARNDAQTFMDEGLDFINDNSVNFPDFNRGKTTKSGKLKGGIIL